MVAGWHEKARSRKNLRRTDQCLQVVVGFGNRVSKKADFGRVASNLAKMLDHRGIAITDGIRKLTAAVETMHVATKRIASSGVITRLVTVIAVIRGDDEATLSYQSPGAWAVNPKPKYRSLKQI